jgi:hypothetical protein
MEIGPQLLERSSTVAPETSVMVVEEAVLVGIVSMVA